MEILEILITVLFVYGFYRLNVSLDRDIHYQYDIKEKEND